MGVITAHPLFKTVSSFFFFNDTATTEIYTLSLHDALPISDVLRRGGTRRDPEPDAEPDRPGVHRDPRPRHRRRDHRSEEHTSELQSRLHLVCRLLLEKKKDRKGDQDTVRDVPPEQAV